MKLYNTLSRQVEDFQPYDGREAGIYTCGPTAYNHAHIGNLRSFVFADILRRAVMLAGDTTRHVMNYTDVDDKTIRRSREEYPDLEPREALRKLTDRYIDIFNSDMEKIGNDIKAITFVRATDYIEPMKDLVTKLHDEGFAYIADDGVYFSIEAYRKSGKTYGQLLELSESTTSHERIHNDEYDKESAHDFALWKKQKDGEPAWEFTLDGHDMTGRPGWHLECSVMSRQKLGQPFDIHTGGIDLIFPHHENEIAQSTAGEENPLMAQFFAHNEHVLIDGQRMAKSAKNFYVVDDLIQKGYDPLAFRLKVLQAHYRSRMNFTWESLEAAQNLLNSLRAWADLKHQKAAQMTGKLDEAYKKALKGMMAALQNDLDTPGAIAHLSELVNESEKHGVDINKIQHMLQLVDTMLGLQLSNRPDITHEQKELIADRELARQNKDWAKSDSFRDKLKEQGLGVRDTDRGPIWYRV